MTVRCQACGRPFNALPQAHCPHCGVSYEPGESPLPPEELEMAVEEITGKPFPGNSEERTQALKNRICYLETQLRNLEDEKNRLRSFRETRAKLSGELAEAKKQLAEWQTQHEGRN